MEDGEFVGLIGEEAEGDGVDGVRGTIDDGEGGQTVVGAVGVEAWDYGGGPVVELHTDLAAVGAEQVVDQQGGASEFDGDGLAGGVGLPHLRQARLASLRQVLGGGIELLPARAQFDGAERNQFRLFPVVRDEEGGEAVFCGAGAGGEEGHGALDAFVLIYRLYYCYRASGSGQYYSGGVTVTISEAGSIAGIAAEIEGVIDAPEYGLAEWGILVVDRTSGETLFERNPDRLFKPASTTKLYSVAAAMDAFGADHRFETPLYRRGEVSESGELAGDLILVASGDPTLGGRTDAQGHIAFTSHDHTYGPPDSELTAPDPLAGLNELARQVAAKGIRRITGDILIDDRLFDKASGTGSGPGRLTPIIVNDNMLDVSIMPGAVGDRATVVVRPETSSWVVDAQVETVAADQEPSVQITSPSSGRLIVRGHVPAGGRVRNDGHEVEDAAAFARALLIEALGRQGIVVSASPLDDNTVAKLPISEWYGALEPVAVLTSPPLYEEAKLILKVSHNLHAGILPLLIAAKRGKRTLADGLHLQREFLAGIGLDCNAISFGSAAGGSNGDLTTPRATVQLLQAMATRVDFALYRDALPILGIDGTLTTAVGADSPARGRVYAKTGTLVWEDTLNARYVMTSKALAGYLTSAGGRSLAFAMFINNMPIKNLAEIKEYGRLLGRLCEIIYALE